MYKHNFTFILLFIVALVACQKTVWDAPKYQKITLEQGDSIMEFRIMDIASTAELGKKYHCFRNQNIEIINGEIIGKPLTDEFQVWNKDQNLIVKGSFKEGLKTGKWTRWSDGHMLSQITFNKGIPDGEYFYFDGGFLVERGKYIDGEKEEASIATESDQDVSNLKSDTTGNIKILNRFKNVK